MTTPPPGPQGPSAPPSAPDPLPAEFRMASGGYGRVIAPFAALLGFFFVVMLLLGSVFGGLGGGIVVAVVATGLLAGVLVLKVRSMKAGTRVSFSPAGVQLDDTKGFRIQLAWSDITAVDAVDSRMASPRSAGVRGGARVQAGAMRSLGLVGWGQRQVPSAIPHWMRDNLNAQPTHPQDGRPLVAIPLGAIDPQWPTGPMGEWVRRHRPDLLPR